MNNLGLRIKNLRLERKIRQRELAKLLEVSVTEISFYENSRRIPPLEKLIRLSEIFEISLNELILGEEECINKYFYI